MKTFVILINLIYIFTFPLNAQVNNTNCNVKQVSDPFNGKIYLISEYETIYTYTPNIHGLYDYYSAFVYKDSSYYFRLAVKTEQGDIWVAYLTGVQIKFDDDAVLDLKDPTKNTEIIKKKGWEYVEFKSVSYTHLRAHETVLDLVCRLLLEKKNDATANICT